LHSFLLNKSKILVKSKTSRFKKLCMKKKKIYHHSLVLHDKMYDRDTVFFKAAESALKVNLVRRRKKRRRKLGNSEQLNIRKNT